MKKSKRFRKLRGRRVIIGDKINFYRQFSACWVIIGDKINQIKEIEGAEGDIG